MKRLADRLVEALRKRGVRFSDEHDGDRIYLVIQRDQQMVVLNRGAGTDAPQWYLRHADGRDKPIGWMPVSWEYDGKRGRTICGVCRLTDLLKTPYERWTLDCDWEPPSEIGPGELRIYPP